MARLKHCSNHYRNVKGVRYEQWADVGFKSESKMIVDDLRRQGYKTFAIKESDCYRIYREVR